MKVIQNFTVDIEQVKMLEDLKEKAGKTKSYLIREFIKYFTEKEKEFNKLIQNGENNEQKQNRTKKNK